MSKVVNLRAARKDRARAAARAEADARSARHGRTTAEKERDRMATERTERRLDGHQRE